MYPVWFMSYRKGDRIAYATVNGQTGKVTADIPVDIKKYTIGSVLLAIPIFIFLNLFFTIKPALLLRHSTLLAAGAIFLHLWEIVKIYHRDKRNDDRGYQFRLEKYASPESEINTKTAISFKDILNFSAFDEKHRMPGFMGALIAIALAFLIFRINPVSDIWSYSGAIASFLGILFTAAAEAVIVFKLSFFCKCNRLCKVKFRNRWL